MAKKSTKVETDRRIDEVANLLVAGQTRPRIMQYNTENGWGLADRQIDTYIQRAKELLTDEAEDTKKYRQAEFTKAIRRHTTIFIKCMQIHDYGRAHQAQCEINKLLALYEQQIVKIQVDINLVIEVVAAIEKLGQNPSDVFNKIIQRAAQSVDADN